MNDSIRKHLRDRWKTERGKALKTFFLKNINEGEKGFDKIDKMWKENDDFFLYKNINVKFQEKITSFIDLRYISLENEDLSNSFKFSDTLNFTGVNLKNCCLDNANIQNLLAEEANFEGINGKNIVLIGATVIDSNFNHIKLIKDTYDNIHLDLLGSTLNNATFDGIEFLNCYWINVEVKESLFKNCLISLSLTRYPQNLYNYSKNINFRYSQFINSKLHLIGVWDSLDFSYTHFKNTKFNYANLHHPPVAENISFYKAHFEEVRLNEVNFSGVNFSEATLEKVHFINSNLVGAKFENTKFKELVLENVELDEKLHQRFLGESGCKMIS